MRGSLRMLQALGLGLLGASSLLLAGLFASRVAVPRIGTLWFWVVLACGVASGLGYLGTEITSEATGGRAAALAAGGLLAMLTNSLMPFAFERGRELAGAATAVGFCMALLSSS